MSRIIDWNEEELQEWCHHCGSLIGYMPKERSITYSEWKPTGNGSDLEMRFKEFYIICPECGDMIIVSSTTQVRKIGSNLYDDMVKEEIDERIK